MARKILGLAVYKANSNVWSQVKELPLTGSGKIQKFALRENDLAENRDELRNGE